MINTSLSFIKKNKTILLVFLPPLIIFLILIRFGVNVPYWDQWEFVTIWQKFHQGTLGFADFWVQHNEHRIVIPRLVMFIMGIITNWNVKLELFISFVISLASFGLIIKLLVSTRVLGKNKGILVLVLMSFLFFSPIQSENWLWGWQIQWFLSVFGLILVVWSLYRDKMKAEYFILAVIGTILAAYSLGNGFLSVGMGIVLLLLQNKRRSALVYTLISVPIIGLLYIGYRSPEHSSSIKYILLNLRVFTDYVLTYLGGSISPTIELSKYVGLTLLVMLVSAIIVIYKQKTSVNRIYPWIALALYVVTSAVLTGLARISYGGVAQAYSSRYTTISVLFVISVVVIIYIAIYSTTNKSVFEQYSLSVFALILFSLTILNYQKGVNEIRLTNKHLQEIKQCSIGYNPSSQCLTSLYPNEDIVINRLKFIKSINYGGY